MGLDEKIQRLCTILSNWDKYQYWGLHMGFYIDAYMFQEK